MINVFTTEKNIGNFNSSELRNSRFDVVELFNLLYSIKINEAGIAVTTFSS